MKVIITGSKTIDNPVVLINAIQQSKFKITEVVSGSESGVDKLGELWAKKRNIKVKKYSPKWKRYGNSARFKRTVQMVNYADAVILLWDGVSTDVTHTVQYSRRCNMPVFIHLINQEKKCPRKRK